MIQDYPDILTVEDVTEILYIGRNTAYAMLNSGELPGFKIGKNWKISRDALIDYVVSKGKKTPR